MRVFALVPAAGAGVRAELGLPKQYAKLGGLTVLARTLNTFIDHPEIEGCCCVISDNHRELFDRLVEPELNGTVIMAKGGSTRLESVSSGLEALVQSSPTHVLIHDGARPLLPSGLIDDIIASMNVDDGAIPVLPVSDALWHQSMGVLQQPLTRANKCRAQTPQGFSFEPILGAYRNFSGQADDDASVAVAMGLRLRAVAGSSRNLKITFSEDLPLGETMVATGRSTRTGFGFDVHQFQPGDSVVLCGVRIPHTMSLKGHSDADVATHAIADAIYGGLAEGDIGVWFPPDDPQWKNADSTIFLRHAAERTAERGFSISNIDCTIICELPRISPHAKAMRERIAGCLNIPVQLVGVKSTTTEGLGFTGRGEGIAAQAVATLVKT